MISLAYPSRDSCILERSESLRIDEKKNTLVENTYERSRGFYANTYKLRPNRRCYYRDYYGRS